MSDYKFPTKEQYKELDELMTYILDEMWGNDDKGMIREAIIAYANKWNEVQANGVNTGASNCNIPFVSNQRGLLIAFADAWNSCDASLIEYDYIDKYLEGN